MTGCKDCEWCRGLLTDYACISSDPEVFDAYSGRMIKMFDTLPICMKAGVYCRIKNTGNCADFEAKQDKKPMYEPQREGDRV